MSLRRDRRRIVIACLLTGLLPAGVDLAPRAAEPPLPFFPNSLFRADGVASVLTFGEPLSVFPYELEVAPRALPWFRRAYSLMRADVTRPMEPVDIALPAAETLGPPGVVQNLRRVDAP